MYGRLAGGKGLKILAMRCKRPVYQDTLKDYGEIQAIDATFAFGPEHIEFAVNKAKRAFEHGENISTNPFIETIVRASGQRQIKKAMDMFGLRGSQEIILFGDQIPKEAIESVEAREFEIEIDAKKLEMLKEAFSITDEEIKAVSDSPVKALKDLIKERIALVSTL
jgi:KEOPS complex subunit Cgi121